MASFLGMEATSLPSDLGALFLSAPTNHGTLRGILDNFAKPEDPRNSSQTLGKEADAAAVPPLPGLDEPPGLSLPDELTPPTGLASPPGLACPNRPKAGKCLNKIVSASDYTESGASSTSACGSSDHEDTEPEVEEFQMNASAPCFVPSQPVVPEWQEAFLAMAMTEGWLNTLPSESTCGLQKTPVRSPLPVGPIPTGHQANRIGAPCWDPTGAPCWDPTGAPYQDPIAAPYLDPTGAPYQSVVRMAEVIAPVPVYANQFQQGGHVNKQQQLFQEQQREKRVLQHINKQQQQKQQQLLEEQQRLLQQKPFNKQQVQKQQLLLEKQQQLMEQKSLNKQEQQQLQQLIEKRQRLLEQPLNSHQLQKQQQLSEKRQRWRETMICQ